MDHKTCIGVHLYAGMKVEFIAEVLHLWCRYRRHKEDKQDLWFCE